MSDFKFKEFINNHGEEVIELYREKGFNKTQVAISLAEKYDIDLNFNQLDTLRRTVSTYINEWENENFQYKNEEILNGEKEICKSNVVDEILNDEVVMDAAEIFINNKDVSKEEVDDIHQKLKEKVKKNKEEYEIVLEYGDKVNYDGGNDVYTFWLASSSRPLLFQGSTIRDLKRAYSDWDGQPETINQICRRFKLNRRVFHEMKSAMNWTHDSEPFTDEEIKRLEIDEMLKELLQIKKFSLQQEFSKKSFEAIKKDAKKWYEFEKGLLDPFMELMQTSLQSYEVKKLEFYTDETPKALVISPFDLHYGKYGWSGEVGTNYDRAICGKLLHDKTDEMLQTVLKYNIEKIFIPVGSDFFHVDNKWHKTTNHTPQDVDGTFPQIYQDGINLMVEFIDKLRQIAPIELFTTAGNHDEVLSFTLIHFLNGYYKNAEDVIVNPNATLRSYKVYGNTLLGFTHGDNEKMNSLPNLMASEARTEWGQTQFRAFFTGHLHHEVIKDLHGVKIYQMPSLASSDRWHKAKGYIGNQRSLVGYIIDKEKGVTTNLFANVIE